MNYQEAYAKSTSLGHCQIFAKTYANAIAGGENEFQARDAGYKMLREIFPVIKDKNWIDKIQNPEDDENEMFVFNEAYNSSLLLGNSKIFSDRYAEYVRLMTFAIPVHPGYCFSDFTVEESITKTAEEYARKFELTYIKSILIDGQPDTYYPLFALAKQSTKIGKENQTRFEEEVIHKFNRNFANN